MGNVGCCGSRKELRVYGFKENELKDLKTLFQILVDSQEETRGTEEFNKKALLLLFEENPELAVKLFKFMRKNSADPELKDHGIDLDTFLAISEALTAERSDIALRQYKKLEKHFLLAAIYLERTDLTEESQFKDLKLAYSDALEFVKYLLRIFQYDKSNIHPIDDNAARVIVDSVDGELDWWTMLYFIRQNLILIHTSTLFYFRIKLLKKTYRLKLPDLAQSSSLLTTDILGLFALSNIRLQDTAKLNLLYGSPIDGYSFQKVITALKHPAPTLILVRHSQPADNNNNTSYIFGGYSSKTWNDDATHSDDDHSYVFSMFPKFRNFFHRVKGNEELNTTFTFFNTNRKRNSNVGIGFGGNDGKTFRLWLDENISEKSYAKYEDGSYEKGALVPPYIKRLNIDYIEIWGLQPTLRTADAKPAIVATNSAMNGSTLKNSSVMRASYKPERERERASFTRAAMNFDKSSNLLKAGLAGLESDRKSVTNFRSTVQPKRNATLYDVTNGGNILTGEENDGQDKENGGIVERKSYQQPPMFSNPAGPKKQSSAYTVTTNYGTNQAEPGFE